MQQVPPSERVDRALRDYAYACYTHGLIMGSKRMTAMSPHQGGIYDKPGCPVCTEKLAALEAAIEEEKS